MSRSARVVIPHYPHHIIQRGNRRQNVFFSKQDKRLYKKLLYDYMKDAGMKIWAYCLMDNHVHLIAVPERDESLALLMGRVHQHYTRVINAREGWKGHLWQGRFSSYTLDEPYLFTAVRYIENNPVRAGLVQRAEDYVWSSAQAHVKGVYDNLISENLSAEDDDKEMLQLRQHERTGRPLGNDYFLEKLEHVTGRVFKKKCTGPKRLSIQ